MSSVLKRGRLSGAPRDRKSTRLNSSHSSISYAVFCLKKKKKKAQSRIQGRRDRAPGVTYRTRYLPDEHSYSLRRETQYIILAAIVHMFLSYVCSDRT